MVGIAQQNNRIVGHAQLYNTEKNVSQPLDACAVSFGTRSEPGQQAPVTTFAFAARNTAAAGQLFLIDVGTQNGAKVSVPIYFPDSNPNDFPLGVEISSKYGVTYMLTKEGYFHLFDTKSGKRIILNQVSASPIFATAFKVENNGIIALNKAGQALTLTINEDKVVPYITSQMNDIELAISLASRGNLPGAEVLAFSFHSVQLTS